MVRNRRNTSSIWKKQNYEKKIITQLKTTDSEIISDMTRINEEIERYYKNFLTSRISQENINDYDDHFALLTLNPQNPNLAKTKQVKLNMT